MDDKTLIFWEPVTWAFSFPFKKHSIIDVAIEDLLSEYSILDLQDVLKAFCGQIQDGKRGKVTRIIELKKILAKVRITDK